MKRIGYVFLAEVVLAGMLVTLAGAQTEPLGDYARAVRKDEKPASAKKYDNDNLPTSDKISVVGNATESTGPEDANAAPEATRRKAGGWRQALQTASAGCRQEGGRLRRAKSERRMETEDCRSAGQG